MELFFSQPVRTYSLILQNHQAPTVIDRLISTGFVQFQLDPYDDSYDPFYMIYSRIRQLKFKISGLMQSIQEKYKQKVLTLNSEQRNLTIGRMKDYIEEKQIDYIRYLDLEEGIITDKITKFEAMANNYDSILGNVQHIDEELDLVKAKLQLIKGHFASNEFIMLTGTCPRRDRHIIQKLIFRKTHGHSYLVFRDRNDEQNKRDMFFCFINKGVYKNISNKINNIFLINRASLYDLPNMEGHLINYQQTLTQKKKQYIHLLHISSQQFQKVLKDYTSTPEASLHYHYIRMAFLQRIIYIICHSVQVGSPANHHMFTIHVPENEKIPQMPVPLINIEGKHKFRTIMPRLPCLYEVNILTQLYSIPKYNEIMPSVFMFSTVPILFGMMFSDMGHGLMLLSISIFLKLGPIFYFMAFMSMYCGFIYNQFFGMKIINLDHLGVIKGQWGVSENGMNFQNSLKMKLSMVIAFVHMNFGILMKMKNQLKRGQTKQLLYDSLPKFVLMFTTIGYLVYLIIMKWLTNYNGHEGTAPSIINTVIEMYLGYNAERKTSILGTMQREKEIGSILNSISLLCILVMVYNHSFRHKFEAFFFNSGSSKYKSKKNKHKYQQLEEEEIDEQMNYELSQSHQDCNINLSKSVSYYHEKEEVESELGALEVFQYILSLISSTTSYLRLFALSLAHSKLSHLLLNFLLSSLSSHQPSISILRCIIFFITTVGMMLALDVMQCLMHVVRLHWVEWMGKFYVGSGVLFKPEIFEHFS